MRKVVFAAFAATASMWGSLGGARAAVMCGGVPPRTAVEFATGSAALAPTVVAAQERAIRAAIGTSKLVGYRVLAAGDLREGVGWDTAPVQSRLADQALARARGLAVVRMLRRLPASLRAPHVSSRLLPNRPSTVRGAGFNGRAGVIVEIGVWYRDAAGVYIAC